MKYYIVYNTLSAKQKHKMYWHLLYNQNINLNIFKGLKG